MPFYLRNVLLKNPCLSKVKPKMSLKRRILSKDGPYVSGFWNVVMVWPHPWVPLKGCWGYCRVQVRVARLKGSSPPPLSQLEWPEPQEMTILLPGNFLYHLSYKMARSLLSLGPSVMLVFCFVFNVFFAPVSGAPWEHKPQHWAWHLKIMWWKFLKWVKRL